MSSYFLAKWRSANRNLKYAICNGVLLTTISVGGNHYPIFATIIHDFSPLLLGADFFQTYDWHLSDLGVINTLDGDIQLLENEHGYHQINTQLAEDIYKCNELLSQTRPRNQKLAKLHKYFTHASAESLWRLIKNSSNPDSYTQT